MNDPQTSLSINLGNALLQPARELIESHEQTGREYPMSGDTRARVLVILARFGA